MINCFDSLLWIRFIESINCWFNEISYNINDFLLLFLLQPLLLCQMLWKLLDKVSLVNHCSFFIKLLLEKKYALPYRVLDATVAHFMRFLEDSKMMPIIWHHSLLAFVQRLVTFIKEYLVLPDWVLRRKFLLVRIICFMESSFGSLTICFFGGKDGEG